MRFLFKAGKLNTNQLKEFKRAFELFDSNSNGKISKHELKHMMQSLNQEIDAAQLNQMATIKISASFNC